MNTPTALAIVAAFGALLCSFVTASYAVVLQRQVRRIAFVADREAQVTQAAADQLHATQVAVDRLASAVAGSQGWFWSPAWQDGEREADSDLAEGHFTRFSSVEEMDTALDKAATDLTASR